MGDKKSAGAPRTATVRVSEELRANAKAYAAKKRMSLQAVLDEALAEYLKKRGV